MDFSNAFGTVQATAMTESTARADSAPTEPRRLQTLQVVTLADGTEWSLMSRPLDGPEAAGSASNCGMCPWTNPQPAPDRRARGAWRRADEEITLVVGSLRRTGELAGSDLDPANAQLLEALGRRWLETAWTASVPVVDVGTSDYPSDVAVIGRHAPRSIGLYERTDEPGPVLLAGGRAYFVTHSYVNGRVEVLDLSDPASPQPVGFYNTTSGYANSLGFRNGRVYLARDAGSVEGSMFDILDLSDPGAVQLRGSASTGNEVAFSVAVNGHHAYLAASGGLDTPGEASGVLVSGATVFVADGTERGAGGGRQ